MHKLFRGLQNNGASTAHHIKIDVDQARVPKDCSDELTDELNRKYVEIGSKVTRNNCIFAYPDEGGTLEYGSTFIIFPIGEYNALWNNAVRDAYLVFEKHVELTVENIGEPFRSDLVNDPLDYVEVMISCQSYHAVELLFFKEYVEAELDELLIMNGYPAIPR